MIQSAHDLVKAILMNWDEAETPINDSCDMVSSRDKAIIERCKEKMREVLGFDPDETEADELLALDSVLRELSE